MGVSDCSETVAYEDVPSTASPAPLQLPSPKTPPTNGAGFKSPVGVTGVTEVNYEAAAEVRAPAVGTPDRHYCPLERAHEKRRLRSSVRCVLCNHGFTYLEWSQAGWAAEKMCICKTCMNLMRAGSNHRAKIQQTKQVMTRIETHRRATSLIAM